MNSNAKSFVAIDLLFGLALVACKAGGLTPISWWLVLAPFYPFAAFVVVIVIGSIVAAFLS